ncbi:MAG: DUF1015 domain-containing protein [Ilumatobacteraceae bacterium]
MPRFEPFAAARYAPGTSLDAVSAPPYDVLSDADVAALTAKDEHNIVRVDVPREADGPGRYDRAADLLRHWLGDGTLVVDDRPTFTLYRMHFTDAAGATRQTVGVIGALEVVDEGADGVLPHERTTPKAKTDRLDLTRATRANLSPVWGLSLADGLTTLLTEPAEPVGSCTDEAGVVHVVERVTDPERVTAIATAVAAHPVLIADGHHRYAISRTYRDEQRALHGGDAGPAELTMTYVAELVGEQLSIDAIHRAYTGVTADELLERLTRSFEVTDAGPVTDAFAGEVVRRGALCLVLPDGTGRWLTPRADAFAGVRDLDGALLEHALDGIDADVVYQHGVAEVTDMVTSGAVSAAVLIRPTGIAEIRRTADERLLMPPKSTFFTPKLRTGLVIRAFS